MKLLKQDKRSVIRMVYEMLRIDAEKSVNYNQKKLAYHVKCILKSLGLRYIWSDQDFIDINFDLILKTKNFRQFQINMVFKYKRVSKVINLLYI